MALGDLVRTVTDSQPVELCPSCGAADGCDCSADVVAEARARIEAGQEPVYDASNPKHIAGKARAQKTKGDEAKNDMNWLMRHPQGRRIMWQLLENCGLFRNAYVTGAGRMEAICFHLGENNMGQFYMNMIMSSEPDAYNLMVKENSGRLA